MARNYTRPPGIKAVLLMASKRMDLQPIAAKKWNSANKHLSLEEEPELQKGRSVAGTVIATWGDPEEKVQLCWVRFLTYRHGEITNVC